MKDISDLYLQAPSGETNLQVGDKVTFTNVYGISFPGMTVKGFSEDAAYIDSECYWLPKKYSQLTPELKPNFVFMQFHSNDNLKSMDDRLADCSAISCDELFEYIDKEKLDFYRECVAKTLVKYWSSEKAEQVRAAKIENAHIGISDGHLGRKGNLTIIVEMGCEIVVLDAGKAWAGMALDHLVAKESAGNLSASM